jgi:hypothetical protein
MTINRCEKCGHQLSGNRVISLFKGLIVGLFEVLKWCEMKNIHEFDMKDIRHLLDKNCYARFGDLALFGLVYKRGKGLYGLPVERLGAFFAGVDPIAIELEKNPMSGELTQKRWARIGEIPSLSAFLDENKRFIARYRKSENGQNVLFV